MIGSIVTINDRESDLYCKRGEVIDIENKQATVMILEPKGIENKKAWDCIVEKIDIKKLEEVI